MLTVQSGPLQAFNLTVQDYATYFVAANENAVPVWVHNSDCNSAAKRRGKASEDRVLKYEGLKKNTQKVTANEGASIPDALTDTNSVEIKDTKVVNATKQIRIQTDYAAANGNKSVLITRANTKISKPAQERFDQIERRDDLGPEKEP